MARACASVRRHRQVWSLRLCVHCDDPDRDRGADLACDGTHGHAPRHAEPGLQVQEGLGRDPFAGAVFFFRGRLVGGYLDADATPGNALTLQFEFVDDALGKLISRLAAQGLDRSTLIIVSAKHGQSPIDVKDRIAQSDVPFQSTPGFGTHGFEICNDVALIWLQSESQEQDYDLAKAYLQAQASTLHIEELLDRTELTPLYGDPFLNSRVPDFIALTKHGAICTGGTKLAEHGGFSHDDRNVLLLVSSPRIRPLIVETTAYTTQIAPTILSALDLDPGLLKGVRAEHTDVLRK